MGSAEHLVLIVTYEGASAYEALGALAVAHAAGHAAELCAREALVPAQEGARVVPHRLGFDKLGDARCVVLPGGDVASALRDAELSRGLRARRGKWLLTAGDATQLAHAAGLTDGRRISRAAGESPIAGAENRPARLVADGRLLTCEGGDALVDLVLHYVAQVDGHDAAARAAQRLKREYRPFVLGAHAEKDSA